MDAAVLDELLGGSARERAESWRYSKNAVHALAQQEFAMADPSAVLSEQTLARIDLPFTRGRRIVFVNGVFSERYSDMSAPDFGAVIRHDGESAFTINLVKSLHLIFVGIPAESPSRWQSSVEIAVQGDAELIEQHLGESGADVWCALTTNVTLAAKAKLRATCFSDLPDSVSLLRKARCLAGEGAAYSATHAHFGGRLQRIESVVDLAGANATCRARGVFALRDRQHVDIHLDLHHNARDTRCDVFWRGVADQRSRGVFHGAITVAAGADGADAALSNKNLLLSAQAEIDTQPVLEIYADEVKASHGATVGALDERILFYLRSRGIPVATARSLLIAAFCREVFDGIATDSLREYLDAALIARLPAADAAKP